MTGLARLLARHVDRGSVPGAVALLARGDEIEVAAAGSVDVEGSAPMQRDSLFRLASVTKPIIAAALMMLVDDGRVALDDPIASWLPELENPVMVRTPGSPVDDVVPATRPITVEDVLSSRAGWGFPADFGLPAAGLLFSHLWQGSALLLPAPEPDRWVQALSRIPLLHPPGQTWLYNVCSDLQGVLIARVSGRTLPEFLAERVCGPLGMTDTGFAVPPAQQQRFTSMYAAGPDGLTLRDRPDGLWSTMPAFPSGAGGLVSTVDDWCAFGRMLLRDGRSRDGHRLLSPESVHRMTTDCLTPGQRAASSLFLEGQGWGYGGSVDVNTDDPWTVPGRYGWVGGSGTSAHIDPSWDTVAVLLTQVEMNDPVAPALMREFWTYAQG